MGRVLPTLHKLHAPLASGAEQQATLATVPIDVDGSFVLEGLPPGPVLLTAAVPGMPVAMQSVDLTNKDADGVVFPLEAPAEALVLPSASFLFFLGV